MGSGTQTLLPRAPQDVKQVLPSAEGVLLACVRCPPSLHDSLGSPRPEAAQIKLCPASWPGLPKRGRKAGVKGFPEIICAGTNLTSSTVPSNIVCVWFFPLEVSGGWRAGQVADELCSLLPPPSSEGPAPPVLSPVSTGKVPGRAGHGPGRSHPVPRRDGAAQLPDVVGRRQEALGGRGLTEDRSRGRGEGLNLNTPTLPSRFCTPQRKRLTP